MNSGDFYVLLLNATSQEGCSWPRDIEHKIVTIVSASNYEEARDVTLQKLADLCWSDVHIKRYGNLRVEDAETDYLKTAIADAQEHGFGWVVYINKH